jgi:uncharacterized repeat protein (TIGR03803 family)
MVERRGDVGEARGRRRVVRAVLGGLAAALALAGGMRGEDPATVVHAHFADGVNPYAGLTSDGAGKLYGATYYGGLKGCGTVFRMANDGSSYESLVSFGCGQYGANPWAAPTLDGAGHLYGTTNGGGTGGGGIVYSMDVDGSNFQILRALTPSTDGSRPFAPLTYDGSGTLYGSTLEGGANGKGVLFKIGTGGSGFGVIRHFSGTSDGARPYGQLLLNGTTLYGTTYFGGASDLGVVFHVGTDGSSYGLVHEFAGGSSDGSHPSSSLVLVVGAVFELTGTTEAGGSAGQGTVFRVRTNGSHFTLLHSFTGLGDDGAEPIGGLVRSAAGNFYGTTYLGGSSGLGVVFGLGTGSSYQTLHSFAGGAADGRYPEIYVTLDSDGVLAGTTVYGGPADAGAVYHLATDGSGFSLRHVFALDGAGPEARLTRGEPGRLYGTTLYGGVSGGGTVFSMNDDGSDFRIVRSFAGGSGDGLGPNGALLFAPPNRLYGTTTGGGSASRGVVFTMLTDGNGFTILHTFTSALTDVGYPFAGVVTDGAGNLYGVGDIGGANGAGGVFELRTDGTGFALLHSFGGPGDGTGAEWDLALDGSGWLYGTTYQGGAHGKGTVFRVQISGPGYEILHDFGGPPDDGENPLDGVLAPGDGLLYGTTSFGGSGGGGIVFRIGTDGDGYEILHAFPEFAGDGFEAVALAVDGAGALYGATSQLGPFFRGGIFRVERDGSGYTWIHSGSQPEGSSPTGLLADGADLFESLYGGGPAAPGASIAGGEVRVRLSLLFSDGFESGAFGAWSLVGP